MIQKKMQGKLDSIWWIFFQLNLKLNNFQKNVNGNWNCHWRI